MSTTALDKPQTEPVTPPVLENDTHLELCCYPGEAACGQDLTGGTPGDEGDGVTCAECIELDELRLDCDLTRAIRLLKARSRRRKD